jgi:U3 small nucleolar RNA-associated protein 7
MRGLTNPCFLAVLGPYTLEYTSNGRYMIVGGRKGHIAMMDMLNMDLIKEFQVSFFSI